jgi:hypothetical protein
LIHSWLSHVVLLQGFITSPLSETFPRYRASRLFRNDTESILSPLVDPSFNNLDQWTPRLQLCSAPLPAISISRDGGANTLVKLGRGKTKDGERSADEERWGISRAEFQKRRSPLSETETAAQRLFETDRKPTREFGMRVSIVVSSPRWDESS